MLLKVTQCSREVCKQNAEVDRKLVAMHFQRAGKKFGGVSKCQRVIVRKTAVFRSYPIGLTADIEKAFLMIGVKEGDRDALRFLWVNNIDAEEPAIRPLRFTRVVF